MKYIFKGFKDGNPSTAFTIGKTYELLPGRKITDYFAFIDDEGIANGHSFYNNDCFEEVNEERKHKIYEWSFQIAVLVLILSFAQAQDSYSAKVDSNIIKHKSERRERRKNNLRKLSSIVFTGVHSIYYLKPRTWLHF